MLRTIGGRDYEFWVEATGKNVWPTKERSDGASVPYSSEELRRLEVGTWRIEVTPMEEREVVDFLTVLAVGEAEAPEPRASLKQQPGVLRITVTWRGRQYRVTFEDDGTGSIKVTDTRSGRTVLEGTFPTPEDASK